MAKAPWPAKVRAVASSALGFCALSVTDQESLCIRALPHMPCLGDKGSLEGGRAASLLVHLQGLLGSAAIADPMPIVSPWVLGPSPTFLGHRLGVVHWPWHSAYSLASCTSSSKVLTGPWQVFSPHTSACVPDLPEGARRPLVALTTDPLQHL